MRRLLTVVLAAALGACADERAVLPSDASTAVPGAALPPDVALLVGDLVRDATGRLAPGLGGGTAAVAARRALDGAAARVAARDAAGTRDQIRAADRALARLQDGDPADRDALRYELSLIDAWLAAPPALAAAPPR